MYETLKALSNTIGMIGVCMQLVVYFLLSNNRIHSNTIFYQAFNMAGACFILYSLFFHWNTPSVVIEVIWLLISVRAIIMIMRRKL